MDSLRVRGEAAGVVEADPAEIGQTAHRWSSSPATLVRMNANLLGALAAHRFEATQPRRRHPERGGGSYAAWIASARLG